jgi:hypothetical protein
LKQRPTDTLASRPTHCQPIRGEEHTLALRNESMAKLSDLSERDRNRSLRVNNVWRPLGLDEELRVLFQADGACWGRPA